MRESSFNCMMWPSLVLLCCVIVTNTHCSTAFNPSTIGFVSRNYKPSRYQTRIQDRTEIDESYKAVEDAISKSQIYGDNSEEARIAWDVAKEMNTSKATIKGLFQAAPQSPRTKHLYANSIKKLSSLLQAASSTFMKLQTLTATLKQMDIDDPGIVRANRKISEQLASALLDARAADAVHGTSSLSASKAWDHVQLVSSGVPEVVANVLLNSEKNRYKEASINTHHQYYTVLDRRSMEDALEAIHCLEHFATLVQIECEHLDESHGSDHDFNSKALNANPTLKEDQGGLKP